MEQDDDVDAMVAMVSSVAAIAATGLAMRIMSRTWAKARGQVPGNPVKGETSWGEATAWAVASGVVIGVVRLAAQRGVISYFQRRRTTA